MKTSDAPLTSEELLDIIQTSLDDDKAEDVVAIDLRGKSSMADYMVVATGRSTRQVAAIADDVAYNHHDLHDGLRAELFSTDELAELPILRDCFARVDQIYPDLNYYRRRHEALRRFFGFLVEDVIEFAKARLTEIDATSAEDIRQAGRTVIRFSDKVQKDLEPIRAFLFQRMYRAPSVVEMRARVTRIVEELFPFFLTHPQELPKQWRKDVDDAETETELARIVSDYIAGMTDRFAIQCHDRFIGGLEMPPGVCD